MLLAKSLNYPKELQGGMMDFKITNNINSFADSDYRISGRYLLTPSFLLFISVY
jgi:hypothetical protein